MARKARQDSRGDMLLGTLDMMILKTLLPGPFRPVSSLDPTVALRQE